MRNLVPACAAAVLVLLAGCTPPMPTQEIGAFSDAANATFTAYNNLSRIAATKASDVILLQAALNDKVTVETCASETDRTCIEVADEFVDTSAINPKGLALVRAFVGYSDSLGKVATTELDPELVASISNLRVAATQFVSTASALAASASPAALAVGPAAEAAFGGLANFAVFALSTYREKQRYQAITEAVFLVDGPLQAAQDELAEQMNALQEIHLSLLQSKMLAMNEEYESLFPSNTRAADAAAVLQQHELRQLRMEIAKELAQAADAYVLLAAQDSGAVVRKLAAAHSQLKTALETGQISAEQFLSELVEFVGQALELSNALEAAVAALEEH